MGQIKKHQEYDDPYRLLAAYIMSYFSVVAIKRVLTSTSFVKSIIVNEAKTIDVSGPFLDCIDQEVIANDKIRGKNACLKELADFYFSILDIERLRAEIRRFAVELGVKLD